MARAEYLATAGADSLIQIFDLSESSTCASNPSYTLLGHAHNVCALDVSGDGKQIASASWDMTARGWSWVGGEDGWTCTSVLVDHGAAVWDVLLIQKDPNVLITGTEAAVGLFARVVAGITDYVFACSACADSRIRLFDLKNARTIFTFKGHTGPVRSLAKLLPDDPDCALFASASNDGCEVSFCPGATVDALLTASNPYSDIIIWNHQTGDSVTTLGSHDSFIYSLVSLPSTSGGGLASSGEDGLIKIWNEEDGELDQEVHVPALSGSCKLRQGHAKRRDRELMSSRLPAAATVSVWSLAALPNGDIACGCSDNLVWIFSRSPERAANEAVVAEYDQLLAVRRQVSQRDSREDSPLTTIYANRASRTSRKEEPAVHGTEILEQDGEEDEVKLVRQGSKTRAYQARLLAQSSPYTYCGSLTELPAPDSGLRVIGMSSARWSKLPPATQRKQAGLAKRCSLTASTTTLSFPSMSGMMHRQFRSLTTIAV